MDETIPDPDVPNTIPKKLRALIKLASNVQEKVNLAASLLERWVFFFCVNY